MATTTKTTTVTVATDQEGFFDLRRVLMLFLRLLRSELDNLPPGCFVVDDATVPFSSASQLGSGVSSGSAAAPFAGASPALDLTADSISTFLNFSLCSKSLWMSRWASSSCSLTYRCRCVLACRKQKERKMKVKRSNRDEIQVTFVP